MHIMVFSFSAENWFRKSLRRWRWRSEKMMRLQMNQNCWLFCSHFIFDRRRHIEATKIADDPCVIDVLSFHSPFVAKCTDSHVRRKQMKITKTCCHRRPHKNSTIKNCHDFRFAKWNQRRRANEKKGRWIIATKTKKANLFDSLQVGRCFQWQTIDSLFYLFLC